MDIMEGNVFDIIANFILSFLVMVLILAAVCFFAKKTQMKMTAKKPRIIVSATFMFIILFMYLPIKPINNIFIELFYKIDVQKNNNTTSTLRYYYQHGFIGGMYGQYLVTMLREPDDYDENEVIDILANAIDSGTNEWGTPNIIMVFSESFWDMSVIDEIQFDKELTSNLHELSKKGLLVNMISPAFGGISCNPEFEILTGGSLKYFPENYIPYMDLYTNDNYFEAPSIINELNRNGYKTKIASCWDDTLFNCKNVYKYYGVDEVIYSDSMENAARKGKYISDDAVADMIINEFDNKEEEPLFYMTLTAQAHMPYYKSKYTEDEYNIDITSTTLDEGESNMLLAYAQGVYDADQQLGRLYDYIQTLDEPTLLIFYGDHLPFLKNSSGVDVYSKLKYFNHDDDIVNTYRMYNTQCIILDNFGAEYEDIDYLGYDLIMPYVLGNMDVEVSDFYKYLNITREYLPVSNYYVSVSKDGILKYTSELEGVMKEYYDTRQKVNWNMFVR